MTGISYSALHCVVALFLVFLDSLSSSGPFRSCTCWITSMTLASASPKLIFRFWSAHFLFFLSWIWISFAKSRTSNTSLGFHGWFPHIQSRNAIAIMHLINGIVAFLILLLVIDVSAFYLWNALLLPSLTNAFFILCSCWLLSHLLLWMARVIQTSSLVDFSNSFLNSTERE